jgi:hypothetical protein
MSPSRPAHGAAGDTAARFLTSYVGTSSGSAHYDDDICCSTPVASDRVTPDIVGPDYDIKQGLQPLGATAWQFQNGFGGDQPAFDIQSEVTVVSGLKVPWGDEGSVPPSGRSKLFHGTSVTPQLAGCVSEYRGHPAISPTADQLVAELNRDDTVFDSLAYRVELMSYYNGGGGGTMGAMSWKRDDAGNIVRVDPQPHPGLAWETLFTGFQPPDPAQAAKLAFEIRTRTTVLDLIGENAKDLVGKLGRTDQLRMEQHFDEIRSLETRLGQLNVPSSALCEQLADPGQDWPVGTPGQGTETQTNKWSNEELRAEVFADLIHMAFVCDLTRAASLMFEHWKSHINMYPATGYLQDLHDITHFGGSGTGAGPLGDTVAWHVKHFARLARRLKDTPDPDGVPILDRTVLTMIFEGGYGLDPEGGALSPHSTENMIVLVAGGRELGLTPGRHIAGVNAHPASVLWAGVHACGVTGPLGDVAEPFVGL